MFIGTSVAPSLASRVKSVEKEMKKDSVSFPFLSFYAQLHRELDHRSDPSALEERGILRSSDSSVLASRMVELEHNMKKDAVNRGLKERSDMNTLVEAGIQSLFLSESVKRSESLDRAVDPRERRVVRAQHEERPGSFLLSPFIAAESIADRPSRGERSHGAGQDDGT